MREEMTRPMTTSGKGPRDQWGREMRRGDLMRMLIPPGLVRVLSPWTPNDEEGYGSTGQCKYVAEDVLHLDVKRLTASADVGLRSWEVLARGQAGDPLPDPSWQPSRDEEGRPRLDEEDLPVARDRWGREMRPGDLLASPSGFLYRTARAWAGGSCKWEVIARGAPGDPIPETFEPTRGADGHPVLDEDFPGPGSRRRGTITAEAPWPAVTTSDRALAGPTDKWGRDIEPGDLVRTTPPERLRLWRVRSVWQWGVRWKGEISDWGTVPEQIHHVEVVSRGLPEDPVPASFDVQRDSAGRPVLGLRFPPADPEPKRTTPIDYEEFCETVRANVAALAPAVEVVTDRVVDGYIAWLTIHGVKQTFQWDPESPVHLGAAVTRSVRKLQHRIGKKYTR